MDTAPAEVQIEDPRARSWLGVDRVWGFLAVALPLLATLVGALVAIDLAYHIRAGELVLDGLGIPRTDSFTFTVFGHAWLDQQWGAQVVFALVHRLGGWDGIALLHAAAIGAAATFTYAACRSRGADARAASLLTIAGFAVSSQTLGMRPQALAVPIFTACIWIAMRHREHPRAMWAIPVLTVIWANVHGSFVLAPVIVGLTLLDDALGRAPSTRRTTLILALTVAATAVTPFGASVWSYAVGIGTNANIAQSVTEWRPPSIREPSGALFFLSATAIAVWLARRRDPVPWVDLAWLVAFFALGLIALRSMLWWGFVFPPVVAGLLPRSSRAPRAGSPVVNAVVVLVVLAGVLIAWPSLRGTDPHTGLTRVLVPQPQPAVEAIARRVEPGEHVFVAQALASWFEFALPPARVFTDSRIELFPDSLWDEYGDIVQAREGWRGDLSRWEIATVVVEPDQPLADALADEPGWRRVQRDDVSVTFVRE